MKYIFGFIVLAVVLRMAETIPKSALIFIAVVVGGVVILLITNRVNDNAEERARLARMTPEERAAHDQLKQEQEVITLYGPLNPALFCSHCQTTGQVRSKEVTRTSKSVTNTIAKVSVTSTTKATQRRCDNCQTIWDV